MSLTYDAQKDMDGISSEVSPSQSALPPSAKAAAPVPLSSSSGGGSSPDLQRHVPDPHLLHSGKHTAT